MLSTEKNNNEQPQSNLSSKFWIAIDKFWIAMDICFILFFLSKFFIFYPSYIPSPSMTPGLCTADLVLVLKARLPFNGYGIHDFMMSIPQINWRFARRPYWGWKFFPPSPENVKSLYNGCVITFFNDARSEYCKRVIGLPGQHIAFDHNDIFVNGESITYDSNNNPFEPESEYSFEYKKEKHSLKRRTCRIRIKKGEDRFVEFYRILKPGRKPEKPVEFYVPEGCVFCCGDNMDWSFDCRYYDFGFVPMSEVNGLVQFIIFSSKYDAGTDDINMSWPRFMTEIFYKICMIIINPNLSRIGPVIKKIDMKQAPLSFAQYKSVEPITSHYDENNNDYNDNELDTLKEI